ncbi:50S ribosomal protein L25 [Sporosalibacterium faouarense]|uniref:50S ribosomal protein L25 n=1 Tax=Sporosalibacterium faouarense TaxID=516123 RepID=UPI00141D1372|nr:50S ribosomal protein L25 [Sporosalibacterium faouarense]MTI48799.1 50S ribosomal protein L25 [Bacillota bacterium]
MSIPKLKVELREGNGKRSANKLRREGFVPAVIYGHNKETKTIKVNNNELEKILKRHGHSGTINIELEKEQVSAIIKEIQKGVVKEGVLHVDFQQLSAGEKIKMAIPINLVGKEKVETSSTIVQQQISELEIQCLPKDIPQSITADVSNLEVGKSLEVGDLEIAKDDNIEILNEESEIVASLTSATREEVEEEVESPIYETEKSILEE